MGRHLWLLQRDQYAIVWQTMAAVLACMTFGCARSQYRQAADQEAYCLIESRQSDPLWTVPNRPVEPSAASRMYVGAEQDCGPKPPDDSAAHRYMRRPDCKTISYYDEIPTRANVENPVWMDYLPRDEEGKVQLTQPLAIDLALLHSREYQTQFEALYLTALDLSGNRFEFDTQWFGGVGADFTANGDDLGGGRFLALSDRLGFGRNLAGGGQFATAMLNNLTWNFGGGGVQSGSAALITTFTQPLLRGAFRHVRLENLTQAERNLLYQVRDFARFRRQFYLGVAESYLSLLTQAQAIRNTEANVKNLNQNLEEHKYYAVLQTVSQVQVDQVFQEYQSARSSLLNAEQNLITSEDNFKFSLGLPAWVSFEIDQSLLEPFELFDAKLVELQDQSEALYYALVQYLPPEEEAPVEKLRQYHQEYEKLRERAAKMLPGVEKELDLWVRTLEETDTSKFSEDDQLDFDQQKQLAERVKRALSDVRLSVEAREEDNRVIAQAIAEYEQNPPKEEEEKQQKTIGELLQNVESLDKVTLEDILPDEEDNTAVVAWNVLENAIARKLLNDLSELYVAQTQIRLFLIDIQPSRIASETAITYAHDNRLDLMNQKAIVMDSFRRVEVAADQLESELNVNAGVSLGSDGNSNSPFKFDSANNQYTLGVQFDGPLNRLNERNAYRASQIRYQQASRDYLALKDQIANEVRRILRQLELSRLNFQIARQRVVAATRQVDLAQFDLRRTTRADANLTIILLQALSGLLDSKNQMIANWVNYRVQKMRLFVALEMLYLDEQGKWLNEENGLEMLEDYRAIDPEYFPPQFVDAPPVQTAVQQSNSDADQGSIDPSEDGESENEDASGLAESDLDDLTLDEPLIEPVKIDAQPSE